MDRLVAAHTCPDAEVPTARTDLLRVAGAGILWGTGGLAGILLARSTGLSPLAVACYRLLVGGLLLVALLAATGRLRRIRRDAAALRRCAGSPHSACSPRCTSRATSPRSRSPR